MNKFLAVVISVFLLSFNAQLSAQEAARTQTRQIGTIDLEDGNEEPVYQNNRLLGEIKVEKTEKKKDPYLVHQDAAIDYFAGMAKLLGAMSRGEKPGIPPIGEKALLHTAAAYLFCSIKKGVCPEYLDTVREIDVINALKGDAAAAECPTMKKFWSLWLDNDMQKKLEYQVHISHMRLRNDFNKKSLPSFLPNGCSAYITGLKKEATGSSAFLRERYKPDGQISKSLRTVSDMLGYFKAKNSNLFNATMPR